MVWHLIWAVVAVDNGSKYQCNHQYNSYTRCLPCALLEIGHIGNILEYGEINVVFGD